MSNWIQKLMCGLGFHKPRFSEVWLPSIYAELVTEYSFTARCVKCNKLLGHHQYGFESEYIEETEEA